MDAVSISEFSAESGDNMERTIKTVEAELRTLLSEYLELCREKRSYSFQGAVSEMAWEIEHDIENIEEDVC